MLGTRSFRSDQACGDGTRSGCDERLNPARSLPGTSQEDWLYDGLGQSNATWQVIAQQVFMAQQDMTNGPGESYNMDAWRPDAGGRVRGTGPALAGGHPTVRSRGEAASRSRAEIGAPRR